MDLSEDRGREASSPPSLQLPRTCLLPILGGMPAGVLALLTFGGPLECRASLGQLPVLLWCLREWQQEVTRGRRRTCKTVSRPSRISPCIEDQPSQIEALQWTTAP